MLAFARQGWSCLTNSGAATRNGPRAHGGRANGSEGADVACGQVTAARACCARSCLCPGAAQDATLWCGRSNATTAWECSRAQEQTKPRADWSRSLVACSVQAAYSETAGTTNSSVLVKAKSTLQGKQSLNNRAGHAEVCVNCVGLPTQFSGPTSSKALKYPQPLKAADNQGEGTCHDRSRCFLGLPHS